MYVNYYCTVTSSFCAILLTSFVYFSYQLDPYNFGLSEDIVLDFQFGTR